MKREDLEHILRAAGAISGSDTFVILGSQAILGVTPDPPAVLLASMDADLYPLDEPGKADLIDGSIGELSPFHEEFGYYAHGVGPETAVLPRGWKDRVIPIQNENTHGVVGLCLHPVDLAISKLLAGRTKDLEFVRIMLENDLVAATDLTELLGELDAVHADTAREQLRACTGHPS
jgi:hypothetical protein